MAVDLSELTLTSKYRSGAQAVGLLRCHVTAALEYLAAVKPDGASIHAARKELKRARAILRLIRESIDAAHYDEEDAALRAVARQLNDVRDADVLLRALARVRNALRESKAQTNLEPLRRLLQEERRRAAALLSDEQLQNVEVMLAGARERTYQWSVANDMDLLTAGMQQTYRKGRQCYRVACEARSDERLHAWRRQVKYSTYQLEAIRSIGTGKATRRLRRCIRAADLLGKDHDLAMLQARAAAVELDAASALHFADEIERRRAKLQRRALRLGARLYRSKTRKFRPLRPH